MRRLLFSLASILCLPASLWVQPQTTHGPDCSGSERWPAMIVFVRMKNLGLVDNKDVDRSKTKVIRLASEQIGEDLWRQVHDVTYEKKSSEKLEAIVVNDASMEECSMAGGGIFLVSQHFIPHDK